MSASPEEVAKQFETAKTLVEEVIVKLGLDPAKLRGTATPALATWTIQRGSAAILVSVAKSDRGDEAFLRAISPVMTLPPMAKCRLSFDGCSSSMATGSPTQPSESSAIASWSRASAPPRFSTGPKSSRSSCTSPQWPTRTTIVWSKSSAASVLPT